MFSLKLFVSFAPPVENPIFSDIAFNTKKSFEKLSFEGELSFDGKLSFEGKLSFVLEW